jgi:hypothetical protein
VGNGNYNFSLYGRVFTDLPSRKANVHFTYLKEEEMRSIRLSLMGLLAGIVFLGFLSPSEGEVKNGRVYYKDKDYGPFLGDTPYQLAFGDFVLEQDILKEYPPNTATHINFFGRCYCWRKGAQTVERGEVADFLQRVSPVCRSRTQLDSSDLIMHAYHIGAIANETLCPNGHPNPITQESENPPPLQPMPT